MNPSVIAEWVRDARQRTLDLVADLDDTQIVGPQLDIINPLLWEIGHVAWFTEKWVLRDTLGRDPIIKNADALWDSIAIPHDHRWDLVLPSRDQTIQYLKDVRDEVMGALGTNAEEELLYRTQYCVFHEDMHTEAFTYSRQTLGYHPPTFTANGDPPAASPAARITGDVVVAPDVFMLGAARTAPFVFDNEMWEHPVTMKPFRIARAAVTQLEFAGFVEDRGYQRTDLWTAAGWQWKEETGASHPVYWKRDDSHWLRRDFDRWVPLEPNRPVAHVNWYEASAYCRWAQRRLPTEAEWEAAASGPVFERKRKRRYPWGDEDATAVQVNMDWSAMGCVDVGAKAAGDGDTGCRQLIGNVWEWTSGDFGPFPGFNADFYKEYSEPWFGTRKVLRGEAGLHGAGWYETLGEISMNRTEGMCLPAFEPVR